MLVSYIIICSIQYLLFALVDQLSGHLKFKGHLNSREGMKNILESVDEGIENIFIQSFVVIAKLPFQVAHSVHFAHFFSLGPIENGG